MIERKPLLECYKSSVFKSVDQAWQQIIAFDLQKKMVVIRSLGKKVYCKPEQQPWLAQLGESRCAKREVAGSNPGRTNTQGLQITEGKVLPLQ